MGLLPSLELPRVSASIPRGHIRIALAVEGEDAKLDDETSQHLDDATNAIGGRGTTFLYIYWLIANLDL